MAVFPVEPALWNVRATASAMQYGDGISVMHW